MKPELSIARVCAQASARAYSEVTFQSETAHVLVVRSAECGEGNTIIAFQGTHDPRAWLVDFQIRFRYTPFGKVHAGFWDSTGSVMQRILALDQRASPEPVIITGHSKGAAEALVCARQMVAAGRPVLRVVTFGGPRVGDAVWQADYNAVLGDVTERWVHEEDIVPRLPPWVMSYRHVGHEDFMSSFGGVEVDPPLPRLALSDLWGMFWGYRKGRMEQLMDHPVGMYQEHLNSL